MAATGQRHLQPERRARPPGRGLHRRWACRGQRHQPLVCQGQRRLRPRPRPRPQRRGPGRSAPQLGLPWGRRCPRGCARTGHGTPPDEELHAPKRPHGPGCTCGSLPCSPTSPGPRGTRTRAAGGTAGVRGERARPPALAAAAGPRAARPHLAAAVGRTRASPGPRRGLQRSSAPGPEHAGWHGRRPPCRRCRPGSLDCPSGARATGLAATVPPGAHSRPGGSWA